MWICINRLHSGTLSISVRWPSGSIEGPGRDVFVSRNTIVGRSGGEDCPCHEKQLLHYVDRMRIIANWKGIPHISP